MWTRHTLRPPIRLAGFFLATLPVPICRYTLGFNEAAVNSPLLQDDRDPFRGLGHMRDFVELTGGVPGKFCTRKYETNWYERSLGWDEGRSIHLSRS
jgi:hypothetical protein